MFIEEETMLEVGAKASGKNSRNYKKLNPIAQSSNSSMVISDPRPGHVPGGMIFDKNPCPSRGAMIDHEMKSGNLKIKSGKQLNHENEHDMIASLAIIDPKIKSVRQTKSKKEYDIISIPRPDSVIGSGLKFGKQSSYQKDFDTDLCSSPGIVIDPAVKVGMLDSVIDNNMKSGKQSNNQKEFDIYTCPSHSVDVDPETELVRSDTEVNYGGQPTNHKVFDMISCPSPDFVIDPEVKVGRPDIMIDTRGKWGGKSKKDEESDVYQCESPGIVIDPEAISGSHSDNKKGFGKITCLSCDTLVNSEAKFGKKSNETKEFDMITINVSNPTRNPGISLNSSCQSSPCPSPGVVYNSDWTSNLSTANASTKTSDAKTSDSCASQNRGSFSSTRSNSLESSTSAPIKRHTGGDSRWEAIQLANSRNVPLGLSHFRLLKRLGYGDIGSVYLVELKGTNAYFAMKVMDKASIANRNKLVRAQTEREILGLLDHPFLPNLYSHFETDKFYCLVMEYCSGGNLHSLRQKQPNKYFTEQAAKFYASEILLALEYLHMLGIIYRDLKPENVLVREEGHIMLSDFDLSLRCSVNPTLVKSSSAHVGGNGAMFEPDHALQGCIQPSTFFPRILPKKNRKSKSDFSSSNRALPELMAEPTNARSMSFVGTHEYLAPEIIKGEGHGSAVDWWTFGIFLYELMHGTTPFKGSGNRATLLNVVGQPLKFPDSPVVSLVARDLIRGLLVKDPQRRIAYRRGATEIKQHPFFEGVNWALVRSAMPPHIPDPVDYSQFVSKEANAEKKKNGCGSNLNTSGCQKNEDKNKGSETYIDFEYF